jgi:hypothetical protein
MRSIVCAAGAVCFVLAIFQMVGLALVQNEEGDRHNIRRQMSDAPIYPASQTQQNDLIRLAHPRENNAPNSTAAITSSLAKVDASTSSKMKRKTNTTSLKNWKQFDAFDRIYYINNLATNPQRRAFMEQWLGNQKIPYERIETRVAVESNCVKSKNSSTSRCGAIASLSQTLLDIISHKNTEGFALVLQDDYIIHNISHLVKNIKKQVPNDWDIVRLNCRGVKRKGTRVYNATDLYSSNRQGETTSTCVFGGGAHAMVWRKESVHKLKELWQQQPYDDVDCRLASSTIKSYCLNPTGNIGKIGDFQRFPAELITIPRNEAPAADRTFDRIYYNNLETNPQRRTAMEAWLGKQPIPFQRIKAQVGEEGICVKANSNRPGRCPGVSGVARTNIGIIDHQNTTGLTLVLEDDFLVYNFTLLEESLRLVPADWDVVRWDCWHWEKEIPATFQWVDDVVFQTAHINTGPYNNSTKKELSWGFCGGAHAMAYRGSSVQKLRDIWSELPYGDIDCRLTNTKIKSYCVNFNKDVWKPFMGCFYQPLGEVSNIPKESDTEALALPEKCAIQ